MWSRRGSFAPGIDRASSCRSVARRTCAKLVLFRMNQRAEDLMMGAPVGRLAETAPSAAYSCGEAQLKRHCGAWRGFSFPWPRAPQFFLLPSVTTGRSSITSCPPTGAPRKLRAIYARKDMNFDSYLS